MPSTSRQIVFIAYEGVSLLDLSGPLEAFRVAAAFARPQDSGAMYECTVVSARGGRVKTADGVELNTKSVRSLARKPIDTLIVPGAFCGRRCHRRPRPNPLGQEERSCMQTRVFGVYWKFLIGCRRNS